MKARKRVRAVHVQGAMKARKRVMLFTSRKKTARCATGGGEGALATAGGLL